MLLIHRQTWANMDQVGQHEPVRSKSTAQSRVTGICQYQAPQQREALTGAHEGSLHGAVVRMQERDEGERVQAQTCLIRKQEVPDVGRRRNMACCQLGFGEGKQKGCCLGGKPALSAVCRAIQNLGGHPRSLGARAAFAPLPLT